MCKVFSLEVGWVNVLFQIELGYCCYCFYCCQLVITRKQTCYSCNVGSNKGIVSLESCLCLIGCITKTRLYKYIENFNSKNWKFSDKNSDIFFHISAQNIDCGYSLEPPRRGGSNEYPQSMFLSRNKKNNVYPCKPQSYYIKGGFKGVKII